MDHPAARHRLHRPGRTRHPRPLRPRPRQIPRVGTRPPPGRPHLPPPLRRPRPAHRPQHVPRVHAVHPPTPEPPRTPRFARCSPARPDPRATGAYRVTAGRPWRARRRRGIVLPSRAGGHAGRPGRTQTG
ncbi:hypothetical protein SCATT_07330 [Streptantibioticus cattleyicolor NRRL 8057 = DSM 46488]|uniref:Uncharacterized protein n=1 Tax=Streptantibioticus cattleyicolor (strain ATCC 35852 / DSM 46488 / JCM 4925 / NBRC 14057 / NRRL 8057) TaxID=1003195 RepID=G8WW10_STREN|nr:hypothetical protein SCATT_07330 [Streptantibioticus cattleyicolor NRRL 8057 = DSM 46488]